MCDHHSPITIYIFSKIIDYVDTCFLTYSVTEQKERKNIFEYLQEDGQE